MRVRAHTHTHTHTHQVIQHVIGMATCFWTEVALKGQSVHKGLFPKCPVLVNSEVALLEGIFSSCFLAVFSVWGMFTLVLMQFEFNLHSCHHGGPPICVFFPKEDFSIISSLWWTCIWDGNKAVANMQIA